MIAIRFIFLLLLLDLYACGQNPIYRNYSVAEGLPSQVVYCCMQDNDGYMWFGTGAGASRFDGKEFKNFTVKDGLTDNDILKIYKDSKGRLWFLTLKGLLCYYYNGKIFNPSNDKTIPTQKAYNGFLSFLEDSNHDLWFGGLGGQLVKIPSTGKPEMFSLDTSKQHGKGGWVLLYQPEKNRIVLNNPQRTVTYNTHDFLEVRNNFNLYSDSVIVYENTSTYKGVLVSKSGIVELNGYEKKLVASADTLPFLKKTVRIYVDPQKGLWVFTSDKNTFYFEKENGKYKSPKVYFTGQNISSAFIDTEGNQWFSTLGNGIYKVAENQKWISILLGDNSYADMPAKNILSVFKDHDNKIWLGTDDGKIYAESGFNEPIEQIKSIEDFNRITAIGENNSGKLFFLADKYIFGVDLSKNNLRQKITPVPLSNKETPKNLCFDTAGNLIFSAINGIRKVVNPLTKNTYDLTLPGVPAQRIYALCNDYRNRLWFEIFERLYCYDNGVVTSYPQFDSLFINKITSIVQTKDSAIAIATQNNGIFFFKDGKIIGKMNKDQGLTGTFCGKLYIDDDKIYVSTNDGISFFTYGNGKVSDVKSFNSGNAVFAGAVNDITTDEKYIYLATSKGLCRIDKQIQITQAQPPVLKLNFIDAGDSLITDFTNLQFDYSKFNIAISFTAITFDQPDKVVYQYKLNNNDRWIESKSNTLQLSELAPGKYNIGIRAKKINSDWGIPQAISFSIIPPFWKTIWFQLLIFTCMLLLIYYLIRSVTLRKYRVQLAVLKAKQQIEEERSRIASDMHDDLGADISKIAVISEVIKADQQVSPGTNTNVQKISYYATGLRKKMDDIIWALDPSNDKLIDLVAHIRELAAEFMEESDIDFDVIVAAYEPDTVLTTTLRRNLFLIVKEAMNNSKRHAAADRVEVRIGVENKKLLIAVSDNGRGFSINNKSIYGNGINNIAKRAAQVNGEFIIDSGVDKGTVIKIAVNI